MIESQKEDVYMWPFQTRVNASREATGVIALFRQPPSVKVQAGRQFYQHKAEETYPAAGDVFRAASFGMSEKEFDDCMRKDAVIKVDSTSHAWTSYSTTMFGHEFSIEAKYLGGRLYRLVMGSPLFGGYTTPKIIELRKAVVEMFTEKYGKPNRKSIATSGISSRDTWDFGGKTIEVVLDDHLSKYDMGLFIVITSTAMEAEAEANREAENRAKYSEYGAYF